MPSDPRPSEQSVFQKPTPFHSNEHLQNDWEHLAHFPSTSFSSFSNSAVKIPTGRPTDDSLPGWIEAFGVDPAYKAPPERPSKPIACFYVLIKIPGNVAQNDYYRAVYLMERTVRDLITSIATKCGVQPAQVTHTLRITPKGLKVVVDDEVVRELPEGQDMIVEFVEVETNSNLKQEAGSGASTPRASETLTKNAITKALEMRLVF